MPWPAKSCGRGDTFYEALAWIDAIAVAKYPPTHCTHQYIVMWTNFTLSRKYHLMKHIWAMIFHRMRQFRYLVTWNSGQKYFCNSLLFDKMSLCALLSLNIAQLLVINFNVRRNWQHWHFPFNTTSILDEIASLAPTPVSCFFGPLLTLLTRMI